jgi:hypothetical protein
MPELRQLQQLPTLLSHPEEVRNVAKGVTDIG